MKKPFVVTSLLVTIVALFGFISLKLAANGPDGNYFNQNLRPSFARYPFFRQVLGLHYDGDARADYLGLGFDKIVVVAKAEAGVAADNEVLRRFAARVAEISGKPASFQVDPSLISQKEATEKSPAELFDRFQKSYSGGKTAIIYVLYLKAAGEEPDLLGSTLEEDGIILYKGALADFTKPNPATLPAYEFSTLLHEFGHQLGLTHNSFDNCLMNERAERQGTFIELPGDVVVNFCPREQAQLLDIRAGLGL